MPYYKDEEKLGREDDFYNYYTSIWSSAVDNSEFKHAVKLSCFQC